MKTTKLINGKTFDEVFAERGKRIDKSKMLSGIYYLNIDGVTSNILCFRGLSFIDRDMDTSSQVFISGNYYAFHHCNMNGYFYEATPNQIELLNMYINHEN